MSDEGDDEHLSKRALERFLKSHGAMSRKAAFNHVKKLENLQIRSYRHVTTKGNDHDEQAQ